MRHKFPTALLLLGRASAAPTGALQPDYVLPSLPDAERPSTPGESPVTHAMQARADPRKDANANAIMARAEWDANAWGALPETAPPLASSYGWRNRYVRIPSAICGSLDCIAG